MPSLLPQSSPQHNAREEDVDDLVPPSPRAGTSYLPLYKANFLQSCLSASVLTFGTFTLKSGRASPYFFNAGLFHRASLLYSISVAYAQTLLCYRDDHPSFGFDVLFGPAYKGIPLATATVGKLAELDPTNYDELGYSFNRKEIKDHGEGGVIVGAPLNGKRVVILDDVITAGTAMKEAISLVKQHGGTLVGIVVALDRMERMNDENSASAVGEVQKEYGVPVLSIISLNDLIGTLGEVGKDQDMLRVEEYKRKYGASDIR